MRPVLFFFILFSLFLTAELFSLDFHYIFSSDGGIFSGLVYENSSFSTELELNEDDGELSLSAFSFRSDYLTLGPVALAGPAAAMKESRDSLIDFAPGGGALLYGEGNPQSNLGVLFTLSSGRSGIGGWRLDDQSRVMFWSGPSLFDSADLFAAQSLTFLESPSTDDSWYLDAVPLRSSFFSNSLLSLILREGRFYGGGLIQVSLARADRGGYSFTAAGGFLSDPLELRGECSWYSDGFVFADCRMSDYPIEGRISLNFPSLPFGLAGDFSFGTGGALSDFNGEISGELQRASWKMTAGAALNLSRQAERPVVPGFELTGAFLWYRRFFTFAAEGKASLDDEIYSYMLGMSGEISRGFFTCRMETGVEIDRMIAMTGSVYFSFERDNLTFSADLSVEDLGLYNYGKTLPEPALSLLLKIRGNRI